MNYYFWLGKEGGGSPVYIAVDYALEDHTVIYDGFGNFWGLCGPDHDLYIMSDSEERAMTEALRQCGKEIK